MKELPSYSINKIVLYFTWHLQFKFLPQIQKVPETCWSTNEVTGIRRVNSDVKLELWMWIFCVKLRTWLWNWVLECELGNTHWHRVCLFVVQTGLCLLVTCQFDGTQNCLPTDWVWFYRYCSTWPSNILHILVNTQYTCLSV